MWNSATISLKEAKSVEARKNYSKAIIRNCQNKDQNILVINIDSIVFFWSQYDGGNIDKKL